MGGTWQVTGRVARTIHKFTMQVLLLHSHRLWPYYWKKDVVVGEAAHYRRPVRPNMRADEQKLFCLAHNFLDSAWAAGCREWGGYTVSANGAKCNRMLVSGTEIVILEVDDSNSWVRMGAAVRTHGSKIPDEHHAAKCYWG